jgi:hypothetical protein
MMRYWQAVEPKRITPGLAASQGHWEDHITPYINKSNYQDILSNEILPHPFGAKRINVERHASEVFGRTTFDLSSLRITFS